MDRLEIVIVSVGSSAEGVGILPSGKKIFVDSPVIPGEVCLVGITEDKKRFARGRCIGLIKGSPDRVIPFGSEVPGADMAHISYTRQLELKRDRVRDCLIRLVGFSQEYVDGILADIVPSDKTEHYRNHMQYSIKNGRFCLKSRGTNEDVPVEGSPLEYEVFGRVREVITKAFEDYPTNLFDGMVLRGSERTGEVLMEFVSYSGNPSEITIRDAGDFLTATEIIRKMHGINIAGIMLRISNTATQKRTRGGKRVCLYGRDHYMERLCGRLYKVKSGAFFQVNVPQAEKLYRLAAPSDYKGSLWDLYCGTGTVGLSLARDGHKLIGVDLSPEAISSAKSNASSFGIDAEFICRPASRITDLLSSLSGDDAVVVDPPRAGLEYSLISSLLDRKPAQISYISCDPATLARDLKLLTSDGTYEIKSITPVDMFPGTAAVECVVLLQRTDT